MLKNKLSNDQLQTAKAHSISVPFIDLKRQYFFLKEQILQAVDQVLSSGHYILGETVESFEKEMANYLNCKYVLGVANGTDAIILALKSFHIGQADEVILPVNSFIATAGAVMAVGAKPVLCDVLDDLNMDVSKIESLITNKTKAIIPVHLTGRPADMCHVMALAKQYSLKVIEDAAQSVGALYDGKMTGTIGDVGCFSLHPLKNLHVYGDGGLITTNDEKCYQAMKLMRNHGLADRDTCLQWGLNSRLDALQAGIGRVSLPYINTWNNERREHARQYSERLMHVVRTPHDKLEEYSIYHNFVILADRRNELMESLLQQGIETKIHYPIPIHLQPAARHLGYKKGDFPVAEKLSEHMLSLPIYAELKSEELERVIEGVLHFYQVT